MGHPTIENDTPLAFDHLFGTDENGAPILVLILKATFEFPDSHQPLICSDQAPVMQAGEFFGEPGLSSYRIEPEGSFVKPATDVVMSGHAVAGSKRVTELPVGLAVGPIRKSILVLGDRFWIPTRFGSPRMTGPQPFERIALRYENAFGGIDPTLPASDRLAVEARNPVGTGYRLDGHASSSVPIRVPNLERVECPISKLSDHPPPACFGFVASHWEPRRALAGTYDKKWAETRRPLLPVDFDRRFFNSAPMDQVVPGYLRGDEEVTLLNVTPEGRLTFRLPGVRPPSFAVEWRRGQAAAPEGVLDTLVIDADLRRLFITWRCHVPAAEVQDLKAIHIRVAGLRGQRRPAPLAPTS